MTDTTFKPDDVLVDEQGRRWSQYKGMVKIEHPEGHITWMKRSGEVATQAASFAKGNLVGVKSGAFSDHRSVDGQILNERAQRVCESLIGVLPWILESDVVAIEQYCRSEARARLLDEYAMEMAEVQGVAKVPKYIWAEISKAEGNAMKAAAELGLTPASRMKIAQSAGLAFHFAGSELTDMVKEGMKMRGTLSE